ncbi:MAG: alpha/beta hydrolase [Capsulimonadales bacterium]|nr:alpha/beta hydrolase [Capsulimonadales bacterium]
MNHRAGSASEHKLYFSEKTMAFRFPPTLCRIVAPVGLLLTIWPPVPADAQSLPPVTVRQDVPYRRVTDNRRLTSLDIHSPTGRTRCPVIVFIHGGGWQTGDKRSAARGKSTAFPRQGYVFVSINYRLAPAVKHPVLVQDCARAIAWVRNHIGSYGGDPDNIFVMGHSAGAHLAALVSTDDRYLRAEGLTLKNLRGTILLDGGSYDMTPTGVKSPTKDISITRTFGEDQSVWKEASPVYNVSPGKDIPPFLIFYVASRTDSGSQSRQLGETLKAAGVRAEVRPAYRKTHGTLNRDLGRPGDPPTEAVYAFLREAVVKS